MWMATMYRAQVISGQLKSAMRSSTFAGVLVLVIQVAIEETIIKVNANATYDGIAITLNSSRRVKMETGSVATHAHNATAGTMAIPHTMVCTTTIETTVQARRNTSTNGPRCGSWRGCVLVVTRIAIVGARSAPKRYWIL
jgi:hypothetical protein